MTVTSIDLIKRHARQAAQAGASANRVCVDLGYTPDLNQDAFDVFRAEYRAEQDRVHAQRRAAEGVAA